MNPLNQRMLPLGILCLLSLALPACVESSSELDGDGDGFIASKDCDDANEAVNPNATESCNGIDDDCDGETDESGASDETTWYKDADGDGYGLASDAQKSCTQPTGYVSNNEDCDDDSLGTRPGATESCNGTDDDCDGQIDESGATNETEWYQDADGDGYGNANAVKSACNQPDGYIAQADDCDDSDETIAPDQTEVCNSIDDDCNGEIDQSGAQGEITWYLDLDEDGYGSSSQSTSACTQPSGYVVAKGDCNDLSQDINPAATEFCDGTDNDCDGQTDESSATDAVTWYLDNDSDGYGVSSSPKVACSKPNGYVANSSDCNDTNSGVNPGAAEVCDTIDQDCDGNYLESYDTQGNGTLNCVDDDGDGYTESAGDCDDENATRHPNATEYCGSVDYDCDGSTNETSSSDVTTWYVDSDNDGYGDSSSSSIKSCTQPSGYVSAGSDCSDSNNEIHPNATEACDATDNDCDGSTDDGADCGCTTLTNSGHYYKFCTTRLSWETAKTQCYSQGYHMLTITSSSEQTWIQTSAASLGNITWWIGLSDATTEGTWTWEDGSTYSYTSWQGGQPDNFNNEDCGVLDNEYGYKWNDASCTGNTYYVCEKDS